MKFLLFCFITVSGSWCKASTYMSVTEGQMAVLDCLLHTDNGTRVVSWYKHNTGEKPLLVLSYKTSNTSQLSYGYGFNSSRFMVQTNANETYPHQLLIITTKEHDSAVYYCGLSKLAV